jgi:delta 1-pyrroline-5-carboxylate dehydrogenase
LSAKLDEKTREYFESVLSNDEAASDEELIQLFVTESGVSLDDATAIVARRMDFLNFMPTNEHPRLTW